MALHRGSGFGRAASQMEEFTPNELKWEIKIEADGDNNEAKESLDNFYISLWEE